MLSRVRINPSNRFPVLRLIRARSRLHLFIFFSSSLSLLPLQHWPSVFTVIAKFKWLSVPLNELARAHLSLSDGSERFPLKSRIKPVHSPLLPSTMRSLSLASAFSTQAKQVREAGRLAREALTGLSANLSQRDVPSFFSSFSLARSLIFRFNYSAGERHAALISGLCC